MLEDYPHDAAASEADESPPACPVDFAPRPQQATATETLEQDLQAEIAMMQTWHDLAPHSGKCTTTGVSGLSPTEIGALFAGFITGRIRDPELSGARLADLLRLAAEDLKAFYFEAVSAQPGQSTSVQALADWFWGETCAALVIDEVKKVCLAQDDQDMQVTGERLLVPRSQLHRFRR